MLNVSGKAPPGDRCRSDSCGVKCNLIHILEFCSLDIDIHLTFLEFDKSAVHLKNKCSRFDPGEQVFAI